MLWFNTLVEALDYLESSMTSAVAARESQLDEELQQLLAFQKARAESKS